VSVHVVVLRLIVDDPALTWWEALDLPDPARWALPDTFGASVFPEPVLEERVR
jgi:hypothetical protein